MEKVTVAILVLFYAITMARGTFGEKSEVDKWLRTFNKAHEKVTHIHFYVHVFSTGPNKADVTVAQGPDSNKLPFFGQVIIMDYYLTEEPEFTSNKIGRAQGIASFNDREEVAFFLLVDFMFTSGEFNGSSIKMFGRNPIFHPLRELPIIGGTGVFRLARGFVMTTTHQFNFTSNNGVYEYDAFVFHY